MAAMNDFLDQTTRQAGPDGRYIDAELPDNLPFQPLPLFDLAPCSTLSVSAHVHDVTGGDRSIHRRDNSRNAPVVADEVLHIFPLLALGAGPSPLSNSMAAAVSAGQGFDVSIEDVPDEVSARAQNMMQNSASYGWSNMALHPTPPG